MVKVSKNGKDSITEFRIIEKSKFFTKLSCNLITGRTHQIRVHTSSNNFPIVGDLKYGNKEKDKKLKEVLNETTIVIHLAGITNVAYTKTDSNDDLDYEITKVGVDGTRNIIKFCPPDAKIIFPSTHVVYEGFEKTKLEINEEEPPCPILTYSKGKVQSENDLINSKITLFFPSAFKDLT